MARYMRGYGQYRLGDPLAVGGAITWHGPGVYLASPNSANSRNRRKTSYELAPPQVLTGPVVIVNPGLRIKLTPPYRGENYTNRRTRYRLGPPTAVGGAIAWHGPGIYLTRPPRPPRAFSRLPRVLVEPVVAAISLGPSTTLAPSRRGVARYTLSAPAVVGAGKVNPGLRIKLVFGARGRARSFLRPPTSVTAVTAGTFSGPQVTLVASPRPRARSTYVYPIVVLGTQAWGYVAIQLVHRPRPSTRSRLFPPAVVTTAVVQVYYGPEVALTRGRAGKPRSFLRPPVILASNLPIAITLAPQRRGVPFSFLRPPMDTIGLEDQGRVRVTFARNKTQPTLALLRPPVDVLDAHELALGPEIRLTYSRRGRPISFLAPPAVVTTQAPFLPTAQVTVAPQRRGLAKYFLSPPAVVGAGVVNPGLRIKLVFGPRPTVTSRLFPPVVAVARPPVSFGPQITLAPSRRPKPLSGLGKPSLQILQSLGGVLVSLAPQRRGKPKSFLRPPSRVFPFLARKTDITLTPQRRGRPLSFLQPPTILKTAGLVQITLAPQRRGKPKSFLRKPVVVRLAVEIYGPKTWLSYSRRGEPTSFLPPAVLAEVGSLGPETHLTRIKPRKTRFFLKPPTVVREADRFFGPEVHLTRITPPKAYPFLKPPSLVGAGIAFYGPQITLVRIKHPPVLYFLPITLVAFRRPHGDVCGFDIAGSFVCSLEVPGALMSGSDSAGHAASGTSQAGSTVTGSDSAGGSVSGSDRKAT